MNVPKELIYTKDHEWMKIEGNVATIGITEFAQGELGDVVYVDIPDDSAELAEGDTLGTIEAVKTVADLFAPVACKIIEVNAALNDAPETVNSDPYGDGWLVKVEVTDKAGLDKLMDAAAYEQLLKDA